MLHRYSLSITERKRLLFLTRRRSISNCNFTNDILRQLLFQGFQRGILETHDLNCSVVCSDVHRDMIVILCKIWWIMVGMAWTGAPCPGFRHSHAPGQGGGMATMLLCYLLAASSTTIIINVTAVVPL